MLAEGFGQRRAGIGIFAGELKGVVIRSAAYAAAVVVEENERQALEILLRGQRGRETKRRDVKAVLAWIATLIFKVAGKRVAQIERHG